MARRTASESSMLMLPARDAEQAPLPAWIIAITRELRSALELAERAERCLSRRASGELQQDETPEAARTRTREIREVLRQRRGSFIVGLKFRVSLLRAGSFVATALK